jgi:hypothetical protein
MSRDELSETDRLVAAIITLEQRLPGGHQIVLASRIDQVIKAIEQFYDEHHELPWRSELIAELTLWRSHAEEGARLMERGYHLLGLVTQAAAARN